VTTVDWAWLVLALVIAAGLAAGTPVILRVLAPPDDTEPGWSYAHACGRHFAPVVGGATGIALAIAFCFAPAPTRPAWGVLGTLGVLLGAIDARTGYLPRRLTWLAAALAGIGACCGAWMSGEWLIAAQAFAGGAIGCAILWAVWRVARGMGFGDVRLAALIGLVAGTGGIMRALGGIAVGAILAAAAGILRSSTGRGHEPYPFGPFLVAGPFLVLVLWHPG